MSRTVNNRTQFNIQRMIPRLCNYRVIHTRDLTRIFSMNPTTALKYIKIIPQLYPQQFYLKKEMEKTHSILCLYNKEFLCEEQS